MGINNHKALRRTTYHKTGAIILHPLEEMTSEGPVKFYADAEEVISHLKKRGLPMILREVEEGKS